MGQPTKAEGNAKHLVLDKCLKPIRPETWKRVNDPLAQYAVVQGQADPSTIRTDTTVVETNIHWSTDSSLWRDVWRVAARLLRRGREICPASCPHRFHDAKLRRLNLFITRYVTSTSNRRRRKVKRAFRTLIERVEWIVGMVREFCGFAARIADAELLAVGAEWKGFLPPMEAVVEEARRAEIQGEVVPACQRVFSIFEPHTELIKRGRREKPLELGHMVLLCPSPEKRITDYEVMPKRIPDSELTKQVIDRHEQLFGPTPEVLAGDKGFCPDAKKYAELEERVGTLAIPRRMRELADAVMHAWQAFRAGIEGTLSGLKRAFRLARCLYRGFIDPGIAIDPQKANATSHSQKTAVAPDGDA